MTEPNLSITDDELHAYVDNELPAERRAAVEAWLLSHPADAERVQSWQAMADRLQARYGGVIDEPVPRRLQLQQLTTRHRAMISAAVAAVVAAFIAGGGVGWLAHGAAVRPTLAQDFTFDALTAHRLYVVEVRHPVEVAASDRAHLQQWLSKRVGYVIKAPDLDAAGLKLVGGRLLPGPQAPAAFFMYESQNGERYTLYTSRAGTDTTQMRYAARASDGALYWSDRGVGYVVSGPTDKDRLNAVARQVYDQTEKAEL